MITITDINKSAHHTDARFSIPYGGQTMELDKLKDRNGYVKMQLSDTIESMVSDSYIDRFQAEYYQTRIRHDKLLVMMSKAESEALPFKPKCPLALLHMQTKAMQEYLDLLIVRAEIEGIDLERVNVE